MQSGLRRMLMLRMTPILVDEDLEIVDYLGDDKRIVEAARVSRIGVDQGASTTGDDAKLIQYLYRERHTSPFEHVRFTFRVAAPIFVARQWFRHRTGSFNEISARYAKLHSRVYVPDKLRKQGTGRDKQQSGELFSTKIGLDKIETIYKESFTAYEELISMDVAKELARVVLPMGTYTEFYWTTDLHNLFHFISLRTSEHAQEEIRLYAEKILELIQPIVPMAVEAFRGDNEGVQIH
jgi:thymidylate synthase (FAD)